MTAWDPSLYLKFGSERTRPAADLAARIPLEAPARIADLGCGPGNSTALLRARYPEAEITGVDSSPDMLAAARASGLAAHWQEADFETWTPPAAPDLIYANAALQWARDPLALAMRLLGLLAPGGALAYQVPLNYDQPSHVEVRAAVGDGPWAQKLGDAHQYDPGLARPEGHARALMDIGARVDVWSTEYLHVLEGPDPVFRWMSGTGLRPFLDRLEAAERDAFAEAARARLASAYPPDAGGRTLFPFRRLFVIAVRQQG